MSGGDSCPVKQIKVYVQSNGIIRLDDGTGRYIGRIEDITYEELGEDRCNVCGNNRCNVCGTVKQPVTDTIE